MEDADALELLRLLALYYEKYQSDLAPPEEMTVSEVAGDLIQSLGLDWVRAQLGNRTTILNP